MNKFAIGIVLLFATQVACREYDLIHNNEFQLQYKFILCEALYHRLW